jgi:hypothetical protein
MLQKSITFTDYNGTERTEKHYFNLSKSEIIKLENSVKGGFKAMLQQAIASGDAPVIMDGLEKIILSSYGIKSVDGSTFQKFKMVNGTKVSLADEFVQSPAYDALFMELLTSDDASDKFMRGLIPADIAKDLPANVKDAIPENLKDVLPEQN